MSKVLKLAIIVAICSFVIQVQQCGLNNTNNTSSGKSGNVSKEIISDLKNYDFATEDDIIKNIDTVVANPAKVSKLPLSFAVGNLTGKVQFKYKPEFFYGKNIHLLNNANEADRLIFWRSTFDFNVGLQYQSECSDNELFNFFGTMRNKATWGVPDSIARTTEVRLKLLDSLDNPHKHFISKQIMWIRELWLKFDLNESFGLPFNNHHNFTIGMFPFDLGRGIALGSAFAVNPGPLGLFSDNSIDQYAFGFKLSGDLFAKAALTYDFYGAILNNKSDNFANTAENIYSQRFGFRRFPERGSGHIDFLAAARLLWYPIQTDFETLIVEPYVVVNKDPECKVEFLADSKVILGSLGLASEFVAGNFEFGFDMAHNFGQQSVFGWDRNIIERENFNSFLSVVNSDVVSQDPNINPDQPKPRVAFVPGSVAQRLIENSAQDASQNGKLLGTAPDPRDPTQDISIFNSLTRFRRGYANDLKGWMIVFDGAYWFLDRQLRFAAGGGVASGDEDPNINLEDPLNSKFDGDFKGFIGIQELYSGNRIQSAFLLGGAGRIPRPLSCPNPRHAINKFPALTSGFSNLIFTGASLYWVPNDVCHRLEIRPNVLCYWQFTPTKKFDRIARRSSPEFARNHLGVEFNTFLNVELFEGFQFFTVGSVFIPGAHFKDIKGTPLNREQQRILDRADASGNDLETLPLLGDDPAWTINVGLEFRF